MIRNVVMGRVPDDLTAAGRATLADGLAGIAGLDLPGQLSTSVGHDAGLRDGAWSFAIVNDWEDTDAYRRYDLDEEHNRYRTMVASVCDEIARVQLELPEVKGTKGPES